MGGNNRNQWNLISNLRVQDRQEPPDHGKDEGDIAELRVLLHIAQVQVGLRAGEVAQVDHVCPSFEVQSHDPPRVEALHQLQVSLDALQGVRRVWVEAERGGGKAVTNMRDIKATFLYCVQDV